MLQSGSHFCAYCYCSIHPVSACCSTCITPTLSHSFSFLFSMSSHGKGKYLSKGQRINIIEKLSKPNPPPKWLLADEYDVSEKTIHKTWDNSLKIEQWCSLMSEITRSTMYQASAGRFTEVDNILYRWIDCMRCANLCVSPSLVISRAKKLLKGF